jgi:RimJ/RimL family protein N-acetyltransferase
MRIQLKRLTIKDLYKLTSILDKETAEIAQIEWPFNRQAASQFINDYNTWGVWINHDSLVGAVEVKEDLETAYFIKKGWRNNGIGTKAIELCVEEFGDQQLWCVINPDNKASLRVAQKGGLRVKFINNDSKDVITVVK